MRQRQVLDALTRYREVGMYLGDAGDQYLSLAALVDEDATRSEVESTRRACRTLAAANLVELRRDGANQPLTVRLSVDAENRAASGHHLAPQVPPWQT